MEERREPLLISAGDTLCWARAFPQWTPANGWALLYEIRGAAEPTAPAIEINSTPDPTNTFHLVNVTAAVSATWAPGEVVLVGYAVNAGSGERHNFYLNNLRIQPNLGGAVNNVNVQTYAQQQVATLKQTLAARNAIYLKETDVQRLRMLRDDIDKIRTELCFWEERRSNEIAVENVNNGRPSGRKVKPVFKVIDMGGPGLGATYPFVPNS